MSTAPAESTETSTTSKAKNAKSPATTDALNKYAAVRLAKKKQRRKAHRKTIKRPNTNG
jgi:hypothetical protein